MLYSALRLGSLSPDLTRFDFGKTARSLTAGALMSIAAAYPSAAQQLPRDECRLAMAVVGELFTKHNGKLSQQFVDSVKSFVKNDCDMATDFKMVEGTNDDIAFGELRVRLIAYRTSQTAKPVSFTK